MSSKYKERYEGVDYKTNNFGILTILEYITTEKVKVIFKNTGYTRYTSIREINKGEVKDLLKPTVSGIGYLGGSDYNISVGGKMTQAYCCWKDMLKRCYTKKHLQKCPTYKGCTVVPEWHNFQNFAKWFEDNHIEGYHLDKDIKVEGNKVYGPDTCMFVSHSTNMQKAHAKNYTIRSPNGEVLEIYNMADFCRNSGLLEEMMSKVARGVKKSYKGYTAIVNQEVSDV